MRLRMMPTTKKKLGSIGLFMRQPDGGVNGPGSNGSGSHPRAGVGHSAMPAPALSGAGSTTPIHAATTTSNSTGQTQLPQLQPPHEIVARQHRPLPDPPATARSIPVPSSRTGRPATSSLPTATMSVPAQHFHPMQRTRTSASDTARETRANHNAWEDSTVASMFGGDHESRAASERLRVHQASHGRHLSDAPQQQQRVPQSQPARAHSKHDENLPFVIGENGILRVVAPSTAPKVSATAPPPSSAPGGIFDDESVKPDQIYHDVRQPYETPTRANSLRRAKLPYRDNRDLRSNASSDRTGTGYSPETQSLNMSPERLAEAGQHIDNIRLQERLTRERDRERDREREQKRERERQLEQERELLRKRSTLFENLTPLDLGSDTADYNDTKAAVVAQSSAIDPEALQEALQRTPRAQRQPSQQAFLPQNILANEARLPALGRTTSSRRLKSPTKELPIPPSTTSRKRRHSLDYNDAELHAMSYTDLRAQPFDFDPQTAVIQQTTVAPPVGNSLEERLAHYKGQGSMDQHEFFTRLPLSEWDEAGDWFLSQFGSVVQRLQEARKAKRQLVQRFEGEVAAREEAVRSKIEGIGRTLEDLRQEGQIMMQGKEAELEY